MQLGPHPFGGGPALAWYAGGEWTLIVLDGYAAAAQASGVAVVSYLGYTIDAPIDGPGQLLAALRKVVGAGAAGRIGVEERALPLFLRAALPEQATLVPIDGALAPLRMRQDRRGAGQAAPELRAHRHWPGRRARRLCAPGATELDVWAAMQGAIQRAAGQRVPLGNDCTVGRRGHSGGWPLDVMIEPGNSFVLDLSTQLHGYWSDSCATYYAGTPSQRQIAMHHTVSEALELGDLAAAARRDRQARSIASCASSCAKPATQSTSTIPATASASARTKSRGSCRITSCGSSRIWCIMLEPGIYFPEETAIRLEHAVLVTDSGAEVLTKHDKRLPAS